MTSAAAALAELTVPGRTLAFCDETDFTNAATSTMVGDIYAWVAPILPSDAYPEVESAVLAYRAELGLPARLPTSGRGRRSTPLTLRQPVVGLGPSGRRSTDGALRVRGGTSF